MTSYVFCQNIYFSKQPMVEDKHKCKKILFCYCHSKGPQTSNVHFKMIENVNVIYKFFLIILSIKEISLYIKNKYHKK